MGFYFSEYKYMDFLNGLTQGIMSPIAGITQSVGNLATNIVATPFQLLGGVLGGGQPKRQQQRMPVQVQQQQSSSSDIILQYGVLALGAFAAFQLIKMIMK